MGKIKYLRFFCIVVVIFRPVFGRIVDYDRNFALFSNQGQGGVSAKRTHSSWILVNSRQTTAC